MRDATVSQREAEIRETLNEIMDPCSVAAGLPVGLVDMGIVRHVNIEGSVLRIVLLPTFPACRFVPIFESEIRKRLSDAALSVTVEVAPPDMVWDEANMAPHAQRQLRESRKRLHDEYLARQARSKLLPVVKADGERDQA